MMSASRRAGPVHCAQPGRHVTLAWKLESWQSDETLDLMVHWYGRLAYIRGGHETGLEPTGEADLKLVTFVGVEFLIGLIVCVDIREHGAHPKQCPVPPVNAQEQSLGLVVPG